jgi:protein phosphatase
MRVEIPAFCLVALVGASGSGKSTFARKYFKSTEVLSSDFFRGLVSDDETNQEASAAAFDSLYYIANKRLEAGKLTVIDATNLKESARKEVLRLAKAQNCFAAAIVFDLPADICCERNSRREDRKFGPQVVRGHIRELRRSLGRLRKEGFRYVYVLKTQEETGTAEIIRTKLWNDKKEETGPFDIIGDVHGCYGELCALLEKMDYRVDPGACAALPPEGRKALFLGDLCDRGPKIPETLRLVMNMCEAGNALCIPGNHDVKLLRALKGADVRPTHGLGLTLEELRKEPPEFIAKLMTFLDGLVSHYVLDGGALVAAHAGLRENLQGRSSGKVREFCLYGDTTGETDEFGFPVRLNWAENYRGRALVVYGHTPSREVQFLNNTVCIDTGCVFGGKLTAFRYPEKTLVSIPAEKEYYAPVKPLGAERDESRDNVPDISDVLGKRHIATRLYRGITLSGEASAAALELMSRFSADPRWLIYLPPTMAPCGTSGLEDYLEYPQEAFKYYKQQGVSHIICEQKHMGSRAVIVVCRSAWAAAERFGVEDGALGIIYTRTGRHFFDDPEQERETSILTRLRDALDRTGFWDAFASDWVCLDTELMPWSAKARKLLVEQYAPVGISGRNGLARAIEALKQAAGQTPPADPVVREEGEGGPSCMDIAGTLRDYEERQKCLGLYTDAYRRYCWPVRSVDDYRIAPFHILATEGKVWNTETHLRHLAEIRNYISAADPLFTATSHLAIDLDEKDAFNIGAAWWRELTDSGGEGMVVKPLDFIARNKTELLQPALKCRGREYLRIIYGAEYTRKIHLDRLRKRSLRKKQSLALAEFSLGMEALERFAAKEPFYRVHECVCAILALENETVDPRL